MAGIGFELKKLFTRRTLLGQFQAYGYSTIITAGPFAMLTSMLFFIQLLFALYGVGGEARQLAMASVVYACIFSQIVSCGFCIIVTRYLADKLYEREYDSVAASSYGVILMAQILGAIVALLFYWNKPLALHLKVITYIFYAEMIVVWLQMVYLTSLKDFKSIFLGYVVGVAIGVILTWLNLYFGFFPPVEGTLGSLIIGSCYILVVFQSQIIRYFDYPNLGMNFEFIPYFEQHYKLFLIMVCYTIAIYVANFIIWTGPWHTTAADTYYYAPRYDVVTFYAFLAILSVMVMFVVSMELKFYEHYAVYFTYITQKGVFQDIDDSRKELLYTLWTEFKHIMEFQMVISLVFLAVGSYLLPSIGVSYQDVNIYRILIMATYFCAVLQIIYTLLLYLEDQTGALMITGSFLVCNVVLGIIGQILGDSTYGFTFFLAAMLGCAVAILRIQYFFKRLNYYVFCARPVFIEKPNGIFSKIALYLYGDRMEHGDRLEQQRKEEEGQ